LLERFRQVLGHDCVIVRPEDLAPTLREWRGLWQGTASCLLRVRDVEQVCTVLGLCHENGIAVTPQGGRTGLVGGGVPQGGIVLDTTLLRAIRQKEVANDSLTVEAGLTLKETQEEAAALGRVFPLSLASEDSARIGGVLATNAGGVQVLRYGMMRDLVLGLEVVLADGTLWKSLKTLRKDNAGYDLKHLFLGSEGTLGVITAAVLRLFPRICQRHVALLGCRDLATALDVAACLRETCGECLSALEYWPRFASLCVQKLTGWQDPLPHASPACLLVELSSSSPVLPLRAILETALSERLERGHILEGILAQSEKQNVDFWRWREAIPEAQGVAGASIKHDISVPLSRMASFVERATAIAQRLCPQVRPCIFGHLGDGNLHVNFSAPEGYEAEDFLALWPQFQHAIHDCVATYEGSIAAEHGIGWLKRSELSRLGDATTRDLMRRFKTALDPKGILNPGKVL
jgi:FAD/FMN-containing dehydrogenase